MNDEIIIFEVKREQFIIHFPTYSKYFDYIMKLYTIKLEFRAAPVLFLPFTPLYLQIYK